ncbi:GNAT family N-acetyltransferase [Candidatus Thorarchaeota archaeon]|nr:MAG: GNAT family N-acetyltransferase [Candidatus Thorarchaeota archaeon]
MIYEWKHADYNRLRELFDKYQSARAIILPALEQNRGKLWVDNVTEPSAVRLLLGVINFFAGDSSILAAREMISDVQPMEALIAPSDDWNTLIKKVWTDRLEVQVRTRMCSDSLDIDYLRNLRNGLGAEFSLERIDLDTVKGLDKRQNMHIPIFFGSSAEFIENGIGFCIKHEGKVVSMASTFTPFIDEFEIQVMTDDDSRYRRRGLATVVSAALLVYALEHGLVPRWDAANEVSVKLALKLGYTNPVNWESFYVKPFPKQTDD